MGISVGNGWGVCSTVHQVLSKDERVKAHAMLLNRLLYVEDLHKHSGKALQVNILLYSVCIMVTVCEANFKY